MAQKKTKVIVPELRQPNDVIVAPLVEIVKKYKVLSSQNLSQLESIVANHLRDGWSLQGGINTTVQNSSFVTYYQSVALNV